MFKRREIKKQEKKEVLINPMLFITGRMTNEGDKFELNPIYLLTDNIMNNVLQSDEIYTNKGTLSYNIQNNIYDGLYSRMSFLIKNEFFKVMDEIRINMINKNMFGKEFESDINEICNTGLKLFTYGGIDDYNVLGTKIINFTAPIINRFNTTNNVYSIDLIINNIVESIYNEYIIKIEETMFYFKVYRNIQLTAEQYSILYDIPTLVTVKLGLSLGVILNQFIDYKQEKMDLISPKALKLAYNDYDIEEDC